MYLISELSIRYCMVRVTGLFFWASEFQWKHIISSSHLLLRLLYEINLTKFSSFKNKKSNKTNVN